MKLGDRPHAAASDGNREIGRAWWGFGD